MIMKSCVLAIVFTRDSVCNSANYAFMSYIYSLVLFVKKNYTFDSLFLNAGKSCLHTFLEA